MRNAIKKKLSEKDQETLKAVGLTQTRRMVKNATKLFGKLCQNCRLKVFANPKIRISQYCETCQKKARKLGFE